MESESLTKRGIHSSEPSDGIRRHDFHQTPFPYTFVRNFLPADIYQGVEENWPTTDRFDREGGGHNKVRFRMGRDRVEHELAAENPAWQALHRHLTTSVFPGLEKLAAPIVRHRIGAHTTSLDWDYILTTDLPGNHFGIHVDPPQRIFSGLLYVGSSDGIGLPGTTVFRTRQAAAGNPDALKRLGLGHYNLQDEKNDLFEEHEPLRFQANSAFLFANCDRAWHGVEHKGAGTRRLIHIVYRMDLEPFVGTDNATLNSTPEAATASGLTELRRQLDTDRILEVFTGADCGA